MDIGFIGLGVMGRPMAANLIAAGHRLTVYRDSAAAREALGDRARFAGSVAEAVRDSDAVVLMLPDTPDVEAVMRGEDGVLAALRPGTLVIDMSSISPSAERALAAEVAEAGGDHLDAPVSGGEVGARDGTLSIMVGGDRAAVERAAPLFEVLGGRVSHIGAAGAGQVAKVANQIVVGVTIEAVAEALRLAEAAGVDPGAVRDALLGGFASSRVLEVHGARMIEGEYEPGFRIALHRKDLGLAVEASARLDVPLPASGLVHQLMNAAVATGLGDHDHSALALLLNGRTG
ncbi:2-hydroxy-3-oxopropionate reductase [Actinomadura sp. WAC 06369]|uniref:2-hydroxy-3-oxopropionate reductase n=1 Tax=Actinomadura sp. WAC 06369 TaxID=2203193 RepID=UPI00040DB9EE|nr:2-hydroxy-3-oxopropionate reductase [Actinomadura sp. WAC 06369]RSN72171.1 2-hydroxy-3-oxopropionate reductase [Actinomadura sp. WAC 06369]